MTNPTRMVLDDDQRAHLRAIGHARRFAEGDVLVGPGDRDYPFMLLASGGAEVVRAATPDRPEMVLRRWSADEFAGEWGLITGEAGVSHNPRHQIGHSARDPTQAISRDPV
jgi:CRP-like cAMP-binding protein